jgi:lipopolysaccharide transport system permease protein
MLAHIRGQLRLILLFARRELIDQYQHSLLGGLWLFLQPLSQILIFTLVFSQIMNAKLPMFDNPYAYTVYLISGILLWTMIANIIQRLSRVYEDKAALIKKVSLSLSLIPLFIPLVELVIFSISILFFIIFLWLIDYPFSFYWLLLPFLVGLVMSFTYVLGLILGLLSVFLPDIKTFVPIFIQLSFWLTPIVYISSILPTWVATWMQFNPFFWAIDSMHQIILHNQLPHLPYIAALIISTVILTVLARWLQQRLEKDIRDLI